MLIFFSSSMRVYLLFNQLEASRKHHLKNFPLANINSSIWSLKISRIVIV